MIVEHKFELAYPLLRMQIIHSLCYLYKLQSHLANILDRMSFNLVDCRATRINYSICLGEK